MNARAIALGFDTTPVFVYPDEPAAVVVLLDEPSAQGLGSLGDANTPIGLTLDASGNIVLPTPDQLSQYLPAGFTSLGTQAVAAAQGAIGTLQGAQPAIGLIGTIASGQAPDPQSIIAAMAATAALVNPVAGAVIGAAGELAVGLQDATQGLFQSLGLISPPPVTYGFNGGFKVGDSVPWGRSSPLWQNWPVFATPYAFDGKGLPSEYVWQHVLSQANAASAVAAMPMTGLLYAVNRYGEVPGDSAGNGYQIGPIGKNDFERFFFEMLKTDFENWWNVSPALPPRDLLMGAVALWNHTHASAPPVVQNVPIPLPPGMTLPPGVVPTIPIQVSGDITYQSDGGATSGASNPIAWLMSKNGDMSGVGREAPPITVNMGPLLPAAAAAAATPNAPAAPAAGQTAASGPTPPASSSSASSSSAAPALVVLGTAAAGTGLWWYLGRPLTIEAAKIALRRLFRR